MNIRIPIKHGSSVPLRFSILNLVLLLMFWAPCGLYIGWRAASAPGSLFTGLCDLIGALSHASTLDDYSIHFLAMLSAPFLFFVILSLIYLFFDFWSRLGFLLRYGVMMGLYIVNCFLIWWLASLMLDHYDIASSCPGGSPILLIQGFFIVFYVPGGFIATLIARSFFTPIYD